MTDDIRDQAARFILRRESEEWSVADEADLAAWLDQSAGHKVAYWRLEHGWDKVDRLKALGQPSHRATPQSLLPARLKRLSMQAAGALAASALPLLATWWLIQPGEATADIVTYATDVGERKIVTLLDGTTVDLNTASTMRVAYTSASRTVYLDRGEAFFEVAHERRRPFIVRSGDREVIDIGTKFLMRRDGARLVTAVTQGQVRIARIDAGKPREAVLLSAGDRAMSNGRATLTIAKDMSAVDTMLSWRSGMLRLDGMTLASAAAQFNRYNRRKLVVVGDELGALKIGGSFNLHNIDGFARLLGDGYDLKIEESDKAIKISRN